MRPLHNSCSPEVHYVDRAGEMSTTCITHPAAAYSTILTLSGKQPSTGMPVLTSLCCKVKWLEALTFTTTLHATSCCSQRSRQTRASRHSGITSATHRTAVSNLV